MKYILFLPFIVSCSILESQLPVSDKMRGCVYTLVGKHGVESLKASETCLKIYKPGERK
jgi:hypothetical protein